MRFQLISDVHLDFHKDRGVSFVQSLPVAAPTLVIAGDVCEADALFDALSLFCSRWERVIYTPGNHDHYRVTPEEFEEIIDRLKAAHSNFIYLNCSSVTVEGVTFHGATLWFKEIPGFELYKGRFADFGYIPNFVPWVFEQHRKAVAFFRANVKPGDVVVTHHLPLWGCIDPEYLGSPLTQFFVGDLESVISYNEPAVCVYGHTHRPGFMQPTEATRLYCNPFGYPFEGGKGFNPGLVIEV